jgi:hypothetical protein
VRIGPHNHFTGKDNPFTHQLVADPTTGIGEVQERPAGKLPELMLESGRGRVIRWDDMIEEDVELREVTEPFRTHLFPRFERKHAGTVMDIGPVNLPVHIFPGRCTEDPFR